MQTDVTRQSFGFIMTQFVMLAALFWASHNYGNTDGYHMLPGFDNIPSSPESVSETYLPGSYIGRLTSPYPAPTVIVSLLLIFVNAFLITKAVSRYLVYSGRTFLPCIFYLIIACGICFPAYDLAAVLAAYLMVRAMTSFISSFVRTVSFGTIFKAAFFIGLTPLLEPQNVIYILLVPIAMLIFRRGGRETIVAIFGTLLPSLFTAYIWWACGGPFTAIFTGIWQEFSFGLQPLFTSGALAARIGSFTAFASTPFGIVKITGIATIVITIVLSILTFFSISSEMRTRAYKVNVFALWFLLLAFISILLPSRSPGNFPVLAIPAAVILPSFFSRQRNLFPFILYIFILASITAANLLPITAEL